MPTILPADDRADLLELGSRGQLIELAGALVQADTCNPPGRELAAARLVRDRLLAAGVHVELQRFDEDRANLVARLPGTGDAEGLMLSGHLDTVPADPSRWSVSPWDGRVRDGRLFGRGALDMKGSVAAMVATLGRLQQSGEQPAGDVVLALTAGEETDSIGAQMLCDSGMLDGVGSAIVGEPTDLGVGIAHRGALWLRVEAAGFSAHGSQPDAGVNAVRGLLDWLSPYESLEQLVATGTAEAQAGSLSLNMIGGGSAPNVVPDRAHAVLDMRTVPGHDHASILRALRQRGRDVSITVLRDAPPVAVDHADPLVVASVAAVAASGRQPELRRLPYVSDASIFASALGVRTVVLGPGSEQDAHRDDESIAVEDLVSASAIYESIIRQLLYAPTTGGPEYDRD
jgi:succinyl-diaminopimelate desuccinylase